MKTLDHATQFAQKFQFVICSFIAHQLACVISNHQLTSALHRFAQGSMNGIRLALLLLAALLTFGQQASAHAVFEAPSRYAKAGRASEVDLRPQARSFLRYGQWATAQAWADGLEMQSVIEDFLIEPTAASLQDARHAWRRARPSYQRTETLRFFNSPIDHPAGPGIDAGPESRINAWPLNEAAIDAVRSAPESGLINDLSRPISRAQILSVDQVADESDVTTGWHAIEFLLWGQDFNPTGPGQRPHTDFLAGDEVRDRRRQYLRTVSALLVDDLRTVAHAWDPDIEGSYADWLSDQPAVEVVGRALHGAASLVAIELYGERLTLALDSRSQEDEHSCFSDNTLRDLQSNLEGVRIMLTANKGQQQLGASITDLVNWQAPSLGRRVTAALDTAAEHLSEIPEPFDAVVLADDDAHSRLLAERAAESLRRLAVTIKAVAEELSIDIVVPGV